MGYHGNCRYLILEDQWIFQRIVFSFHDWSPFHHDRRPSGPKLNCRTFEEFVDCRGPNDKINKSNCKVVLKINASKHKCDIRKPQNHDDFQKILSLKVSVIHLVYNRFCFKRVRSKLQKLRIAIFGQN